MKHIYSALFGGGVFPFHLLLDEQDEGDRNVSVVRDQEDLKEKDSYLVVWGGADINPDYYSHPHHSTTYPGGERDRLEWSLMTRAVEMGIPIIGVCRGAQMLCARAGGWLIQNVRNHGGTHWCETNTGDMFVTNSIHHQMMAGLGTVDHELVVWCREPLSKGQYGYKNDQWYEPGPTFKEPEFVYFPKIKGFAIQWHPESMGINTQATKFILDYIKKKEEEYKGGFASAVVALENGE